MTESNVRKHSIIRRMFRRMVAGTIALGLILPLGYAIGGSFGGAILVGVLILGAFSSIVAPLTSRLFEWRWVELSLDGKKPIGPMLLPIFAVLLTAVGALLGFTHGANGVINFINESILRPSGLMLDSVGTVALAGALCGGILGLVGAALEPAWRR